MAKDKVKLCKTKGCNNPVIEGKYCLNCTQKRKETQQKVVAGVAGAGILGGGAVVKKVGIKKVVEVAGKALQLVLRR